MKKKEIKGLSAFELLGELDDDMILSASLPEATPVATPTVGERISAFFGRMGKGGMAAAITGIVVALAVLVGVALARPFGGMDPPDTDPSHGIHNGTEADPDTNSGIINPPVSENPGENPGQTQKGPVAVVSDGMTVYPKGYCVYLSEAWRDENGELMHLDGDGYGAVYQLAEIWDELPTLRTAGNSYELALPDHMTLRNIRAFEMISLGYGKAFGEIALPAKGTDPAIDLLNTLTGKGDYIVVLDIYHEINYSSDEYTRGVDEYAFRLTVDPSMNHNAPVRVIHGDKTYFPTGHLLESSYYDAELQKEVVKQYDGATYRLGELIPDMVTAALHYTGSITPEGALSLYLAPFYELKEITVYDADLNLIVSAEATEPLEVICSWNPGDYYVIITAAFMGTGETTVTEYPIHIKVVEEREEESTPAGDVGETPDAPRVDVSTGWGNLYFGSKSISAEYHEGYMLFTEQYIDGERLDGDGFGAEGQLDSIADSLPAIDHDVGSPVNIRLPYAEDTLTRVEVYDKQLELVDSGKDAAFLTTLPMGTYIIVLTVETKGDYVPEVDTYERTCTEYAFWLRAEISGSTEPIS